MIISHWKQWKIYIEIYLSKINNKTNAKQLLANENIKLILALAAFVIAGQIKI